MAKFRFYALKLSLVIIFVFVLQVLIGGFTELFVLSQEFYFQIWRFFTAIFLHSGLTHLIFNLFALLLFGSILEKLIGGRRFLIVFFVTGILANLISVNFYTLSLGASGAIFGILGTLIVIKPGLPVWVFGLPMPIFVAGILWVGADLLGVFGFGETGVGNIAHLSGLFLGLVFGFYYHKLIERRKRIPKIVIDERSMQNWEDNYMR